MVIQLERWIQIGIKMLTAVVTEFQIEEVFGLIPSLMVTLIIQDGQDLVNVKHYKVLFSA